MVFHESSRSLGGALVSVALLSAGVVMAYRCVSSPPAAPFAAQRQAPGGADEDALVAGLSADADASRLGAPRLRAIVARRDPAGGFAWSRTCAGSGAMSEPRAAVGSDGSIIVGLTFEGAVDCGTGPLVAAGGAGDFDALVLALDRRGEVRWIVPVSDLGAQAVAAVALDPWGSVLVAGSFEGSVDLGGPPLVAEAERDVLLAKLDADGRLVWQRRFGGSAPSFGVDVDVARSGRVVLLARSTSSLDLGTGELLAPRGSAFLATFDADGHPLWSHGFGGGEAEIAPARVRALPGNQILVTGTFAGALDLGAGVVSSAGRSDAFVARLDASGQLLGSARLGALVDRAPGEVRPDEPAGLLALRGLLTELTETMSLPRADSSLRGR